MRKSLKYFIGVLPFLVGSITWGKTPNYGEALQKSLFFYDVQRSGSLPKDFRVTWRGDSALSDGQVEGIDLTGGWYDAGDHVKFGFPAAGTATLLAWSLIEDADAYKQTGQYDFARDNLKWINDYFMKTHPSKNVLWGQVGEGGPDHAYWGPPEVMPMKRKASKIDSSCPGSDLAAETAAAMAAASMVFVRNDDPDYAEALRTHSIELYDFAYSYRGVYSNCIQDAAAFYRSSGYMDELVWGGLWLYKATGNENYLRQSEMMFESLKQNGQFPVQWTHSWDDKTYGSYILLYQLTGQSIYKEKADQWLDYWTVGTQEGRLRYTPGGLAWLDMWGSLRYASNTAMLSLIYSRSLKNTDPERERRYWQFGKSQIDYILGVNPAQRSYVIGYGENSPINAHHRAAHGSWSNNIGIPERNRHILYGALVGGPDLNDQYSDNRSDYVKNEVALDYNAGFQGAVAVLVQAYGGFPEANFPKQEQIDEEFFTTARINAEGEGFVEIALKIHNRSSWPARVGTKLTTNYYFDLSETNKPEKCAEKLTVTTNYNQGVTLSKPLVHNLQRAIFKVTADFSQTNVKPTGESDSQKEVQFRLNLPRECGAWRSQNDFSNQGLVNSEFRKAPTIPVFEGEKIIWGSEP